MSGPDRDGVHTPVPRRPFSLAASSDTSIPSRSSSPSLADQPVSASLEPEDSTPARSRSILNLTSSTLLGIYSRTGYQPDREGNTPWGTGAETPIESRSRQSSQPDGPNLGIDPALWQDPSRRRRSSVLDTSAKRTRQHELVASKSRKRRDGRNFVITSIVRTAVLGIVGWCYGVLISHLHDRDQITPVKVDAIPHHSRRYLIFWGIVAVVLGSLLPWVDHFWESEGPQRTTEGSEMNGRTAQKRPKSQERGGRGERAPGWNDAVRSIGALVGIAFAIRRLPWQSTLQLSLTLALSNPAIWYLLDRTSPGFILATAVAFVGTALCMVISPDIIPPPSSSLHALNSTGSGTASAVAAKLGGILSNERIGVATWIASVLFVSCVCFGNVGRRI